MTGVFRYRSRWATSSSSGMSSSRMSTTKRITLASFIAVSICRSTSSLRSSRSTMPIPPVSISSKNRGFWSSPSCTSVPTRSRVTPAWSSTMAILRPASQFKREDLPTLGRPTITTLGRGMPLSSPIQSTAAGTTAGWKKWMPGQETQPRTPGAETPLGIKSEAERAERPRIWSYYTSTDMAWAGKPKATSQPGQINSHDPSLAA